MRYADRLDQLPVFVFSELRRRISELQGKGIDVISLGSGDPDQPTPEAVVRAAQSGLASATNHQYPENKGKAKFRKAVSSFYQYRFNVTLDPEGEVFPILGGKEAIHHLSMLMLSNQDVCLSPTPGYPPYRSGPILAGGQIFSMPLAEENGFQPDLSSIPSMVLEKAKLIYLNYPNNPTGAVATDTFFSLVVEFAREHNLLVVHDNAYSELAFDGYKPKSFLSTPGAFDIGVEVFSLSKGWNMTGWRVGSIVGNRDVISRYAHLKPNIDSGICGALQDGAITALTDERDFPKKMSKIYQARRDLVVSRLKTLGLDIKPQKATPFIWCKTPRQMESTKFTGDVLDRTGVVLSPGSAFGAAGEGYFRIALMTKDEALEEAIYRVEQIL